ETLAGEFNSMSARLEESYAGLEQKVEERTRELTKTLAHQTATAEVLRVISASLKDVQPVFDAIAKGCAALFPGSAIGLWIVKGAVLESRARSIPVDYEGADRLPGAIPLDRATALGTSVLDTRPLHVPDLGLVAEKYPRSAQQGLAQGYRSILIFPLI